MGTKTATRVKAPHRAHIAGRDPLLGWVLSRGSVTPWRVATATLALGFGVLGTWYLIVVAHGDVDVLIHGLSAYLTGSFGDSLLLPPAAAISLAALQRLGGTVAHAGTSESEEVARARRRLDDALGSFVVAWGPFALACAIVGWYHLPWVTDAAFWSETVAPKPFVMIPALWHAAFMVLALWWLLAFVVRLVLVGAILLPRAARAGGVGPDFLRSASLAWRRSLELSLVLAVFATLLWIDRVGPVLPWDATAVEPPVGLTAALVVPVIGGLVLYERLWIAPIRVGLRTREEQTSRPEDA